MTTEIPRDLVPVPFVERLLVERLLAERRFLSVSDALAEGLRLLQARESLRQEVQRGFAQLDSGLGVPAEVAYARAEEQIHTWQ